jgi:sodium-dependent dicarboxylate transporter 2/3/5
MMLPMATSVIALAGGGAGGAGGAGEADEARGRTFSIALLLGIAYAGNIGGLGTLIGTPPNALLAGFMSESYGIEIGFVEWMFLGVPIVAVSLPFTWFILTRWLYPVSAEPIAGGAAMLRDVRQSLGPISRAEWAVGTITALTAAAWVMRPIIEQWIPAVTDAGIAITGALLMFSVPFAWRPLRVALTWAQAERLPWSVLILFGGGLSLAAAIQQTGLAEWIGSSLGVLGGWPVFAVIVAVVTVVIFLTELTSNTATAAAFLPVVASLAVGIGADPMALAIPTALAASCAFMLPVATPPNAIVYGTGALTIPQMAKAGLWLNLFFVAFLPLVVFLLAGRIFGGS